MLIVFDGQEAWIKNEEGVKASPLISRTLTQKAAIREWFSFVLQPPEGMTMELKALPDLKIKGIAMDVINVTIGPAQFTACFDKQTHLLTKMFYDMQPGDGTVIEDYHHQYKPVTGIRFAHQFLGYADGKRDGEILVRQYKISQNDTPQQFTKPQASQ